MKLGASLAAAWAGVGLLMLPSRAEKRPQPHRVEMDAIFAEFQGRVPGASVLVLQNGKVAFRRSYGLADVEKGTKATPRTNYRLASLSKQFTATAILLLVQRGKLSLDDSLTAVLPEFPLHGRSIRIRHLLNHTSGVLTYEDLLPENLKIPVVDTDVLRILSVQDHGYFAPGSQFRYSNSGYALLACIVERVSGMSYPEFMARNIFRPLGMKGTFLTQRANTTGNNRAFGYSKKDGAWMRTDQSMTSFVLGDGGIYSSLENLRKWDTALASARILPAATIAQSMSGSIATREEGAESYGYGWFVGKQGGEPAVWHTGSTMGFRNAYVRIPGKSLTVIVLTNRNDADAIGLARKVTDVFLH